MPSKRKRHNPLKDSFDIFAEESLTPAEKIIDGFISRSPAKPEEKPQELSDIVEQIQNTNPEISYQEIENELLELLDKYYNGDRDVPVENRYKNKDLYKQLLIHKFQQWGFVYVEKKHYPLSKPEKLLIRIDFFGTINKPRKDQTSETYRKNKKPLSVEAQSDKSAPYELSDYNLETSPTWRLMRIFPRFHNLKNKIRLQMHRQGLNPENIPYLNIYDYSDLLYNYFKTEDTKDGDSVTIFLGARQSFVKDVFKKNEAWVRQFFKHRNYDERYCEALIQAAQKKGITGNIKLKSTSRAFILDYIQSRAKEFSAYMRTQAQDGKHINSLLEQLNTPKHPLNDEMRGFIYKNENTFRNYFKYKHITSRHIHATFELLSHTDIPPYVKENLKKFANHHSAEFQTFLKDNGKLDTEIKSLLNHFHNASLKAPIYKHIIAFAKENKFLLRNYLNKENRDDNYIRFIENSLTPPPLPEHITENLHGFICHQAEMLKSNHSLFPKHFKQMFESVITNDITPENENDVRKYILHHRKEYSTYFKEHNASTYRELNEQLTDTTNFIVSTQGLLPHTQSFAQKFISQNKDIFRYWYANFQQKQYQENASQQYEKIKTAGITSQNFDDISHFIFQRLDSFTNFCQANGLSVTQSQIRMDFKLGNILKQPSALKEQTEAFIRKNSYIYRRALILQQISQKEKEADIIHQKITKQGLTSSLLPIAHKFILNNKQLFTNNFLNNSEDNDYAMGILNSIRKGNSGLETQAQAKKFIQRYVGDFEDYIRNPQNIERYVSTILTQIDKDIPSSDASYWSIQFISQDIKQFEDYLQKEKIGEQNIQNLINKIHTASLAENLKINFNTKGMELHFHDGTNICVPKLAVHHKCAVQDSSEQINISNLKSLRQASSNKQENNSFKYPNLAAANYYSNLCVIVDDPYHIRFFHGMDSTEKFDNCERYIARLYPADPHIIFFGSLDPQDQLSYDYSQDPRSKRYHQHTERMRTANAEAEKKEKLPHDISLYVITGSHQGNRR